MRRGYALSEDGFRDRLDRASTRTDEKGAGCKRGHEREVPLRVRDEPDVSRACHAIDSGRKQGAQRIEATELFLNGGAKIARVDARFARVLRWGSLGNLLEGRHDCLRVWLTKQLRKKLLLRAWLACLNRMALSCDRAVSSTSCATDLRLSSTSVVCVLVKVGRVRDRLLTAAFFVQTVEETLLVLDCNHLEGFGRHEVSETVLNLVWERLPRVDMPTRCPWRRT